MVVMWYQDPYQVSPSITLTLRFFEMGLSLNLEVMGLGKLVALRLRTALPRAGIAGEHGQGWLSQGWGCRGHGQGWLSQRWLSELGPLGFYSIHFTHWLIAPSTHCFSRQK